MSAAMGQTPVHELKPRIVVIGVGGAGGNAVDNMIDARLEGVEFVAANTDAQALSRNRAPRRLQLGARITEGLGAGARPEVGAQAAEDSVEDIRASLDGAHMVFITAGMGGGTGTGAAPVVARVARECGAVTVAVVTRPFDFEGGKRQAIAQQGIAVLEDVLDTLIVIPNQNLFRLATEKTTFAQAFKLADDVLLSGVRGVTDLVTRPGLVNLDFADIRTVMGELGAAILGSGEAEGERRALDAAQAAICNPLIDDISLKGARAALINITGGYDMTLYEVDEAANEIRNEIDADATIIVGSAFDESLKGKIRVSLLATGILRAPSHEEAPRPAVQRRAEPAPAPWVAPPLAAERAHPAERAGAFSLFGRKRRAEPERDQPPGAAAAPEPAPLDDPDLEIPAFLRRQAG